METIANDSLPLLKNKKPHVSYSEVSSWKSCSFRHKLIYIDGLTTDEKSPHLFYGTIIHDAVENFLKGAPKSVQEVQESIKAAWLENGFDSPEYISKKELRSQAQGWKYNHDPVEMWLESAKNCIEMLPAFLEKQFPGWKSVAAEHALYEDIEGVEFGKFKGFIDSIIELPNGKHVILDWKTAGPRGWSLDKKRDFLVQAQLILYKHYWMKITGKSSRDVKTAFVLLKKNTKPKSAVDIVEISSGPKMTENATKMVRSMVSLMQKGLAVKNRLSCKFCEFQNTQHCT